jgi:hypothetical protein
MSGPVGMSGSVWSAMGRGAAGARVRAGSTVSWEALA